MTVDLKAHIGELGEKIATYIYERDGHEILFKNLKTRFGEIDLITQKNNNIYFVEVKVSNNPDFGLPIEKWTKRQKRRFGTAIKVIISKGIIASESQNLFCEFISIDLSEKTKVRFKRYKNISLNL